MWSFRARQTVRVVDPKPRNRDVEHRVGRVKRVTSSRRTAWVEFDDDRPPVLVASYECEPVPSIRSPPRMQSCRP